MSLTTRLVGVLTLFLGCAVAIPPAHADINPHEQIKDHVREIVQTVKAAPNADEKRALLDEKLRDMMSALDRAEQMAAPSSSDQSGVDALRSRLQEKIDELNGQNGYETVPDDQLNNFADYVQQDFEQADRTLTISLVSGLLILILLVLLL